MRINKRLLWFLTVIGLSLVLVVSVPFQARADTASLPIFNPSHSLNTSPGSLAPVNEQSGLSSTELKGASKFSSLAFPIRAAFYYPWFPEGWKQLNVYPYSEYTPSLGFYNQSNQQIIHDQVNAMLYGNIQAGIASWWGQGSSTDLRIPMLLAAAQGTDFKWAVYYERESQGDPTVSDLTADLTYLRNHYGNDPGYLHVDNRFVVFVYADSNDGCGMVDRWKQANTVHAYIVLKVFSGYQGCTSQPDGWHQYAPANAEDAQGQFSFTISPGYWKVGEDPLLDRNLRDWQKSIQDMVSSNANFQLITTFNEWGEGTAVESASQWNSSSGYGSYLDALHAVSASTKQPPPASTSQATTDPVVLAAGDIASCASPGDVQTAALLKSNPGTIITLGDNAYESGSLDEFNNCYNPTWGQFKAETHPAVGNHEYLTPKAAGYYKYFGAAAGDPTKGYYSFDLGTWHIIVLNANCSAIGGCGEKSPEWDWLNADLAAHSNLCTMAVWHQPRFSSGEHGDNDKTGPFWQVLYQYGADLVLNGHDHDYERFAPQDPSATADAAYGIREFVVGTGGKNRRPIVTTVANSEVHNDSTWGILKLTLHPKGYDWKFIPVAGASFTDSGSANCHSAPSINPVLYFYQHQAFYLTLWFSKHKLR